MPLPRAAAAVTARLLFAALVALLLLLRPLSAALDAADLRSVVVAVHLHAVPQRPHLQGPGPPDQEGEEDDGQTASSEVRAASAALRLWQIPRRVPLTPSAEHSVQTAKDKYHETDVGEQAADVAGQSSTAHHSGARLHVVAPRVAHVVHALEPHLEHAHKQTRYDVY